MEHGMLDPRMLAQARMAHAGGAPQGAGAPPMEMMGMDLGGGTPPAGGMRGGYAGPVMPGRSAPVTPPPGTPPPYQPPPGLSGFAEPQVDELRGLQGPQRARAEWAMRNQMGR